MDRIKDIDFLCLIKELCVLMDEETGVRWMFQQSMGEKDKYDLYVSVGGEDITSWLISAEKDIKMSRLVRVGTSIDFYFSESLRKLFEDIMKIADTNYSKMIDKLSEVKLYQNDLEEIRTYLLEEN